MVSITEQRNGLTALNCAWVGVPQRHCDGRMAEQILNRHQVRAPSDKTRGECMSQIMKATMADARAPDGVMKAVFGLRIGFPVRSLLKDVF